MDFTREPIIETIITPREGHKLVIRNSKGVGQEEYFVDAVEIVAFGHAFFFRSLERPKAFIVPVSDYEVLEVKEARMVLKNAGLDRSIKIGGGREGSLKAAREMEKGESLIEEVVGVVEQQEDAPQVGISEEVRSEVRTDKKRDRRRHYRKRRGKEEREEGTKESNIEPSVPVLKEGEESVPVPEQALEICVEGTTVMPASTLLSSLLQPPPTLISETINRYRQNELFKGAFYLTEEEQYKPHDKVQELLNDDDDEEMATHLQEPTFAKEHSFELESSISSEGLDTIENQMKENLENFDNGEENPQDFVNEIEQPEAFSFFSEQEEDEESNSKFSFDEEDRQSEEREPSQESHTNHHEEHPI